MSCLTTVSSNSVIIMLAYTGPREPPMMTPGVCLCIYRLSSVWCPWCHPIIDTMGTTHYLVGKYISELLQPLTQNEFTLKDTFVPANRMKSIPPDLFNQGYKFVSFNVESVVTNVHLQWSLNIILDRIFNKRLIDTNLNKSTLWKLTLDTCTKTVFLRDNKVFEQIEGLFFFFFSSSNQQTDMHLLVPNAYSQKSLIH